MKCTLRIGLLAALLVSGLFPAGPARADVPTTPAFALAERMLERRGCEPTGQHSLTRDNLAYALVQTARMDRLDALLVANPGATTDEILACVRTRRWQHKVRRDLESPGTNGEILARLRVIGAAFARFTRDLQSRSKGAEWSLLLAGSLVKGHLSAGSDIDVIVDTRDEELASWAGSSVWATTHPDHPEGADETIAIADAGDYGSLTKKMNLRLLGQTLRVEGRAYEEDFLEKVYLRLMEDRGLLIHPASGAVEYLESNHLHRFERELPIWLVNAIGQAKDWRGKLKELFSGGEGPAAPGDEFPEPMGLAELGRRERFARAHGR